MINLKNTITAAAIIFLTLGAYSLAKAECANPMPEISKVVETATGIPGVKLTEEQTAELLSKKPIEAPTQDPVDAYLFVSQDGFALVYLAQNDCAFAAMGPVHYTEVLELMGVTHAKGERID